MQVLLLLVVCVAFVPFDAEPGSDPNVLALYTWLGVAAVALSAELMAWFFAWRLRHRPFKRAGTVRAYHLLRTMHLFLILGSYFYALFGLHWGATVRTSWNLDHHAPVLVGDVLILAPFLAMVVLGWLSFFRVERALSDASGQSSSVPAWTRWSYLSFHARHYLGLVLAPILLFKGIQEALAWAFAGHSEAWWYTPMSIIALMTAVLLVTPWLLIKIWQAQPLDQGSLRSRLEVLARRLGFRYTEILLWNTRGGMANAMVTGMFAVPRYVLLSDGLLRGLTDDEVEAVFGHEMGHVKHHHMPLYMGFAVLSLFCLVMLGNVVAGRFEQILLPAESGQWLSYFVDWQRYIEVWGSCLGGFALLGCYVWLVFGFLSRRCERQADVFGCKAVSCGDRHCTGHDPATPTGGSTLCPTGIRTFMHALERVAELNGIRRDKPSWRHSSIARRVAFLERLLTEPEAEPRFQRRLAIIKACLLVALGGLCAFLVWQGGNAAESMRMM